MSDRVAAWLLSVGFVSLTLGTAVVGVLGFLGGLWAGFDSEVAVLLAASAVVGTLAMIGLQRLLDGARPWKLMATCVGLVASCGACLALMA